MPKNNFKSKQKVAILGASLNGLVAACYLAKAGYKVEISDEAKDVYLTNNIFKTQDFKFEFCANWYFLPEIIKDFWTDFDKNSKNIYEIKKLAPNYKVFFENQDFEIGDLTDIKILFSKLEPGSGVELEKLLRKASIQYKNYIQNSGFKPVGIKGLFNWLQARLYHSQMNKQINNQKIIQILKIVPSLAFDGSYKLSDKSLMFNFADFGKGNYYPVGGYEAVLNELTALAKGLKVKFNFCKNIQTLGVKDGFAKSVKIDNKQRKFNLIVSCLEQDKTRQLLPNNYKKDWLSNDKKMPQTRLIKFAFGLDCKAENLQQHNIFYDCDWTDYSQLFKKQQLPKNLPFFVDCPGKIDETACLDQSEVLIASVYLPANVSVSEEEMSELKNQFVKRISEKALFDIEKHMVLEQTHQTIIQNSIYLNEHTIETKIDNLYYLNPQTNPETNFAQAVASAKQVVNKAQSLS